MLTAIRFTATGCCSAIGNFSPNDIARVSPALAAHLVNEARAAEYIEAQQIVATHEEKPKRRKKADK